MRLIQTLLSITFIFIALSLSISANAQYTKVTYIHTDADGSPFAATDRQGNIEWHIDHYPYGSEYRNTEVARKSDISFAGKPYDEEIGLSYFGGRWYDPDIGRFTGIDPMPVNPEDYRTFNRYSYGFNNPHRYVDPDGNLPILVPLAIFVAKEVAAEAANQATGGALEFLSFRRLGTKAVKQGIKTLKNNSSSDIVANGRRGRESEARVLKDLGLTKNNQKVSTSEGNSIPDALTNRQSIEIKDTKCVSCTKQVRIQTDAARKSGRESVLITGENTKVSKRAEKAFDVINKRKDLGPKK